MLLNYFMHTKSKFFLLNPKASDITSRQKAADLYVLSQSKCCVRRRKGETMKSPRLLNFNNFSNTIF